MAAGPLPKLVLADTVNAYSVEAERPENVAVLSAVTLSFTM